MSLEEKLIGVKTVYHGKYVQAEERIVRLLDGREAVREIVRPPDAVGVLPIGPTARFISSGSTARPSNR